MKALQTSLEIEAENQTQPVVLQVQVNAKTPSEWEPVFSIGQQASERPELNALLWQVRAKRLSERN